ncbi:MAG: hypothetical protein KKE96_04155 [Candidatus Altiarchaeota archaeon]|nr:hypothetical protein [Candidatus Altiarchaeota archaeon]
MKWKDIKLGLFSAGAGVGLFGGSGLLLMGKGMIGLIAFLLGVWNFYLMFIHLDMEELKAREFALKYPGFAFILLSTYVLGEKGYTVGNFVTFLAALLLVYVGLDFRRRRLKVVVETKE